MALPQPFNRFTKEAVIIGRLLLHYARLELDLMNCVNAATNFKHFDSVLKKMFSKRLVFRRENLFQLVGNK